MFSFPPVVLRSCSFIDSGQAIGQKQNDPYDHSGKKNKLQMGRRLLSAGPETQCKRKTRWICSHVAPVTIIAWLCSWNLFVPRVLTHGFCFVLSLDHSAVT